MDASEDRVTVAVRLSLEGQTSSNLYTVQLVLNDKIHPLFKNKTCQTFSEEDSSLDGYGVAKLWAHITSKVPESFLKLLPSDAQTDEITEKDVEEIGHFFVYDYYPQVMSRWTSNKTFPLRFERALKFAEQILTTVAHLERSHICHLELTTSSLLISETEQIALGKIDCALKFEDDMFLLSQEQAVLLERGCTCLAPEILDRINEFQSNPIVTNESIDFSSQSSFGVGVLISEICTGRHPLPDYPSRYIDQDSLVSFTKDDLRPFPSLYPKSFHSIVQDLLACDPQQRLSVGEALNQLRVCCMPRRRSTSSTDTPELRRVRERSAESRALLKAAYEERDSALAERDLFTTQRDAAIAESHKALLERDKIKSQRDSALAQRDEALRELKAAVAERDAALNERDALISERDLSTSDTDSDLETDRSSLAESVPDKTESDAVTVLSQNENTNQLDEARDVAIMERDVAVEERAMAVAEMERMSEQCEKLVSEFQSMADHSELLLSEIEQLRSDRDSAVHASQSAYQASELLREQLSLITRERDLAQSKVEELQEIVKNAKLEEQVVDCIVCHSFFLESQNTWDSCSWHTGKYLFNRWSCCYKRDSKAIGCKAGKHKARPTLKDHTYDMVPP